MEFHPPIKERTDKQLFDIIENKEGWKPEAFKLAQSELLNRGFSISTQTNRRNSKRKFKSRIDKIKSSAEFTRTDLILLIMFGLPLSLIFQDFSIFYSGDGFKRKNRQGTVSLILGLILWALIIYLIVLFE
nr:hypothetical protein [uncultured Allomuricauda sp.]